MHLIGPHRVEHLWSCLEEICSDSPTKNQFNLNIVKEMLKDVSLNSQQEFNHILKNDRDIKGLTSFGWDLTKLMPHKDRTNRFMISSAWSLTYPPSTSPGVSIMFNVNPARDRETITGLGPSDCRGIIKCPYINNQHSKRTNYASYTYKHDSQLKIERNIIK